VRRRPSSVIKGGRGAVVDDDATSGARGVASIGRGQGGDERQRRQSESKSETMDTWRMTAGVMRPVAAYGGSLI
jgi:hypothetical protein